MRIDGTGRIILPNGKSGASGSRGTDAVFRPDTGAPAARAAQAAAPAPGAGIAALLALQSVDDPLAGRRKAVRRAGLLLDALEEIRADLLAGRVSEGRLNRAAALLGQAKAHSEPGLDELVADIELRVRVELAKLGQYPGL